MSTINDNKMKEDQQLESLEQLKRLLRQQPPGHLAEETASNVRSLLFGCWELLDGSEEEGTSADKLLSRMEDIRWEPPYIHFQIERHGGAVMGSSRAEIHDWSVNLETATAACSTGRFRQIQPRNPPLDVQRLVEEVVHEVRLRKKRTPNLKWVAPDKVRVIIGKLVPANCPEQTLLGRRKRFRKLLEPRLAQLGWHRMPGTAANTYQEAAPGTGWKSGRAA
jgi:hypothetical protein